MQAFQDAFISYGRADSLEFATKLNRHLVDRGFTVWFDYDDIPYSVDYQKQIDDGIERADNFLFIISPHSIHSKYCRKEIELALQRGKRIIPLLHVERISREIWQQRNPKGTEANWAKYQAEGLHECFGKMHPAIQKLNWIYVREGMDDFEAALAKVLEVCDKHKAYVHQHTRLLAKALEWERQHKQASCLLIGEERLQAEDWLRVRFTDSQPPCTPTDLHCEFITESRKNADNLMTDVFLAYAEADRATAEAFCKRLQREGFTVWTNTADIQAGADFQQVIEHGIEEADNLVYLLSPAAVSSPWCQHELDYALSLHKRVIPVRVAEISPDQMPLALRNLQYIDLTDNQCDSDYQQDISDLLRVLRQAAAYHTDHKLLLAKALKWERQQRNPTMLLRGYNLRHAEDWLKIAQKNAAYPATPLQETFITESQRQPPVLLDVFISYSRADSGFARQLNEALQVHGKRTWFDQESIAAGTADFQQEIHRGIESADTFLFILSPRSIASPYCADEVEYAARLNKRFVTLLYQPIDVANLHPDLKKVQWLDFNQHNGDFSANLADLLRVLETDGEHIHAHTRLLLRAIEWEEKGRKESLLLRGDELEQAEQWLNRSAGKEPQPTELQHNYVMNSRSVEEANQQATQILRMAAAKGKKLVVLGALAGGMGLLIAGLAGFFAFQATVKIKVADVRLKTADSKEQFQSGKSFQALLTALKSGQLLNTQFKEGSVERKDLHLPVMAVLQQALNGISEKNTLEGHRDESRNISLSPDGKTIALSSTDNTVKLWDVTTGAMSRTLKENQSIHTKISFSPDSKTIAFGSGDNLKLREIATGKLLRTFKVPRDQKGDLNRINEISFSRDGKTIASSHSDNTIKLWDVKTGKLLHTLKKYDTGMFSSMSFSPDGKTIASGSGIGFINIWDVATGKPLHTFKGHKSSVESISFSPDSKTLYSLAGIGTIKQWKLTTGKLLKTITLQNPSGNFESSFSPDGKMIASTSLQNSNIEVWEVATGKLLHTLKGHQDTVWEISFSSDGKTIVSGSGDGVIKVWKLTRNSPSQILKGHQAQVRDINFSPDNKTIVSSSTDKTIKVWDVAKGKLLRTLKGHRDDVSSISFSPDGKTIASGSNDNTIKLWTVATGKEVRTLKGLQNGVWSISFSPDGKMIASGDPESIKRSPDGKTYIPSGTGNSVKLWDVATGKLLHTFKGHQNSVTSVRFSPDVKMIASGSYDGTIKLWDVATRKLLHTFQEDQVENKVNVYSISFSPDGKMIASGNEDNTIRLWDVATGKLLHTLKGHEGSVWSISFRPDGKTLASGSDDKTIKLWDVATGELLHSLTLESGVTDVSFSPDGKTLASVDYDDTIKLWVWDYDRLMSMGCQWIQEYLITHPDDRPLCKGYLPGT